MEEPPASSADQIAICHCCLCTKDEQNFTTYTLQTDFLRVLVQCEKLTLCSLCNKIAQRSEKFIENVQNTHKMLETMSNEQLLKTNQPNPIVVLENVWLGTIVLKGDPDDLDYQKVVVTNSKNDSKKELEVRDVKVKIEMMEDSSDDCDDDFVPDCNDFERRIKEEEEDEYPLRILKEELELEGVRLKCIKKEKNKKKIVKKTIVKKKTGKKRNRVDDPNIKIEMVHLTREQCLEEMASMAKDEQYANSVFQCKYCVKGFSFKGSFEKHMEKHSETMGDYECDICKLRTSSEEKLRNHYRYHTQRFRCLVCGLTRISKVTMKDHYTAKHCDGLNMHNCSFCSKTFKRKLSLRKHITYTHKGKAKIECQYCHKLYSSNPSLKAHCIKSHPTEVSAVAKLNKYPCEDCEKSFPSPSHLRKHSLKHSQAKNYYCVECNKSFKSDWILKHHLKTAMPHVNYAELPLPCAHCDKRFAIRRDLERHTNRVHLNIKPFKCDQCDRAYINSWSLIEHRRLIHEGYKRPLRFPCTMCHKVFDRKEILKGHIRTHTGERPYQCSKCPAQFSQASVLGTHVKLIHLRLTRDGRPKGQTAQR